MGYQKKSVGNAQIIDDQKKNEAPEKMKDCTKSLVTQSREKQMQTKEPLSTGNDSDNESSYSDDSDLEKSMGNCCQGLSNKIRTVLRINVPTGDASQTNSNDEAEQRQPILNETPPMFGEDSSSSETASPGIELNEPTFYHISPSISRPLSEMTEEEQLEICQRLAIIGQMSSTIVREEDKRIEENEIKSEINVPTGDASQASSNDEAKQRQLILNKTPPMFGEDSSSSETASPRIELNEPTFYHISPCIRRPLSEMTEEEQLEICQRLAIIGQMSSISVREEDKLKDVKELKSDTGTMIDQSTVTNKHVN